MKKVIAYQNCWECPDRDPLAPILRTGIEVLFDDCTRKIYWNNEPNNDYYDMATEEERLGFYAKCCFIKSGDEVEITKGRTLKIGDRKIVKSFYTFTPPGTYGHNVTDYVVFADGTKINIRYIKPINETFKEFTFCKELTKYPFELGGQK